MKKITIVLMLMIGIPSIKISLAQVTFQKIDSIFSIDFRVQQTSDGGYIASGTVADSSNLGANACLLKLDNNGDKIWSKSYTANSYYIYGQFSEQTTDGGYILSGYMRDTSAHGKNCLIKTNSVGSIVWSIVFGSGGDDHINDMHQTNDGGYIIAYTTFNDHSFLVKTNSLGIISWMKRYSFFNYSEVTSVKQTIDGGFIVVGAIEDSITSLHQIYLIKTDSLGNSQWAKIYSRNTQIYVSSIIITNDGGFLMSGQIGREGLLLKTDNTGNVLWSKKYSNIWGIGNAIQTNDNGYAFAGTAFGFNQYLAKTDSLGNHLWSEYYSDTSLLQNNLTQNCFVNQTTDGGYIVSGFTNVNMNVLENGRLYLIKTDALGQSGCNTYPLQMPDTAVVITTTSHSLVVSTGINVYSIPITSSDNNPGIITLCSTAGINEVESKESFFSIYPNPSTSETTISFSEEQKNATINIRNTLGQLVYTTSVKETNKINVMLNQPAGVYFVDVLCNGKRQVMKLIKE